MNYKQGVSHILRAVDDISITDNDHSYEVIIQKIVAEKLLLSTNLQGIRYKQLHLGLSWELYMKL